MSRLTPGGIPARDSPGLLTYAEAVAQSQSLIRMKLDVSQPIDLGEFVSAFTAMAAEYDRFMRADHPDVAPDAALYVKHVRDGCIEADLVPTVIGAVAFMAGVLTIDDFIRRYGARLAKYLKPGGRAADATKSELKHFSEQVAAIANTAGSSISVAAIEIDDGKEKVKAIFRFDSAEAQDIQQRVEEHKRELDHTARADKDRVLMVFTRSDVRSAALGKRSGEHVVIEAISDKSLPLIYASDLAEQQIKHEIAEAADNVYKKGFSVDVNVESRGGRPVAYSVTNLHRVIDLPDED